MVEQLEPAHAGQAQVEHDAVEPLGAHRLARASSPLRGCVDGHVVAADQLDDAVRLVLVVLDDQQVALGRSARTT